ncbi:MAG: hypothetical protein CL760_06390 [Chloroflexi bacterium]|nr:hypothetical protein [Chloroflexota bacterium]|tara:strand:- start:64112 stop:64993 length:882 start_codon:yes stop_codon:yes gene_type:complete
MELIFDKKRFLIHKGHKDLTTDRLTGGQPIFTFFAKENETTKECEILDFDWVMQSKVAPMNQEEAEEKVKHYNVKWKLEHDVSEKALEETTHIITGYYNLLTEEFVQTEIKELESLTVEALESAMVVNYIKSNNDFYNDKELLAHNIKATKVFSSLGGFLEVEFYERLDLVDYFNVILDWFEKNKTEIQKKYNQSEPVIIPIKETEDYMKARGIQDRNEKGESNVFNLMKTLKIHDVADYKIYEFKEQKYYTFEEFGAKLRTIDADLTKALEKSGLDFREVPVLSERFYNTYL